MKRTLVLSLASAALVAAAVPAARAQTAYGVEANGNLYSFNLANPALTNQIGTGIGFTPAGIDFNPLTGQLFGIEVTATTTQLFTINLTTGASTAVGVAFANSGTVGGVGYNFGGATSFGFDFNPKTVQPDNAGIRIRFVGNDGTNLRLNSLTGQISNVDGTLNVGGTVTTGITAVAYTNNFAQRADQAPGPTALFDINSDSDTLFQQTNPNGGGLTAIGGLTINAATVAGFDIFTAADNTTNTAYLVTDAVGGTAGTELYTVDLGTGAATLSAAQFGAGLNIVDLAVQPVPEPSTYALTILGALGVMVWLRRGRQALV